MAAGASSTCILLYKILYKFIQKNVRIYTMLVAICLGRWRESLGRGREWVFQDGNGRLSGVLTTLLLLKSGYRYFPYSSMGRVKIRAVNRCELSRPLTLKL